MNKLRFTTAIIFSAYFIHYCLTYTDWHFLDNVNLIIHEAGHVIFIPFGQFLYILGGSLFQIIVPAIFAFYFYKREEYFSASLLLFWIGQSIINVSVYASDALAMNLPLLGGDSSGHDWNNLLQMTNTLKYTKEIGMGIFIIGILVIVYAIYFSFVNSFSEKDSTIIQL